MDVTLYAVDFMDGDLVIVELSDGRTIHVTVDQILSSNPQVYQDSEMPSDSD